jgi:transcriptional regulator with XRE-family HTH domain
MAQKTTMLRLVRVSMALSQAEVAKRCKLQQTRISQLELGRRPTLKEVKALAIGLNIAPEDIFEVYE